ncbi:MAG: tetratricopeptide repeat protein [Syntrophobacteraceae bacterium]
MLETNPLGAVEFMQGCTGSEKGRHPQSRLDHGDKSASGKAFSGEEAQLLSRLRQEPFSATPHAKLGAVYWNQGRTEDALNSLTRALELDPTNKDAIVNSSMVFRSLGREDDAQDILRAYLNARPDDHEVRSLLTDCRTPARKAEPTSTADFMNEQGESQYEKGRRDRARACFEMAIESDPGHWSAHGNLGVVCWEDGDTPTALEHLYSAMTLNPDDPDILHNCFLVLKSAGHLEAAADVIQHILQKGLGGEADWLAFRQLLQEIGSSSWAPDGLTSNVANIYVTTGTALLEAGDHSGAATALERALRIDAGNGEAYHQLGRVATEAGDLDLALELIQKGLDVEPENQAAKLLLDEITRERTDAIAGAD